MYSGAPPLSEFIGSQVCSDNRKVRINKACTFIYRAQLEYSIRTYNLGKYSNRTVTLQLG